MILNSTQFYANKHDVISVLYRTSKDFTQEQEVCSAGLHIPGEMSLLILLLFFSSYMLLC